MNMTFQCYPLVNLPICQINSLELSPGRIRQLLKKKLVKLQQDMLSEVQVKTIVTCPNILLEFGTFHISQVLDSCHSLFTIDDVVETVEIWRNKYADDILKIAKNVLGGTNIKFPDILEQSYLDGTNFSDKGT